MPQYLLAPWYKGPGSVIGIGARVRVGWNGTQIPAGGGFSHLQTRPALISRYLSPRHGASVAYRGTVSTMKGSCEYIE